MTNDDYWRELDEDNRRKWWEAYNQFREDTMPKYSDIVKSEGKTLSAKDLIKPVRVTISGWKMMEFDDKGKTIEKAVLTFEGAEKAMVLNLTRCEQITLNLGTDDMDDWVGQKIILEKGRTKFGSEMVDCVAVRDEGHKEEPANPNDDCPF